MKRQGFWNLVFLFFGMLGLAQKSVPLDSLHYTNEIALHDFSSFATSKELKSKISTQWTSHSIWKEPKSNSNFKSKWQKFTLSGVYEDTLYVYAKNNIAKIQLFYDDGKTIQKIGHSGFANRLSDASVPDNYNGIQLAAHRPGDYYIQFQAERYHLESEPLFISPYLYKIKSTEKIGVISLIVAGFQICLFVICMLFLALKWFKGYPKLLIFFTLINVTDAIYFLSRYQIINLELSFFRYTNSQIWNVIGDVNIICYYIFYSTFFKIPSRSWAGWIIKLGSIFWVGQIFIELSNFNSDFGSQFAKYYLNNASVVDFFVFIVLVIFVLKNRLNERFYVIGFVGLIFIFLSTAEVAWPHLWGLNDWVQLDFTSFGFMQFAAVINIFSIVCAVLYDYILKERAASKLKTELVQKELEELTILTRERERISHDMHDELGAGISAMKLQAEFLKMKLKKQNVEEDIDDLLKTTEDLNISMREMLWSLNSGNDTLGNLIKYINMYGETFFRKSNMEFSYQMELQDAEQKINSENRRNIFLCIKEAFNNCYKHSEATHVNAKYSQQNKTLKISIEDNGKGIPLQFKQGNGLKNMRFRMLNANGRMDIQSDSNGTYLKFEIPLD